MTEESGALDYAQKEMANIVKRIDRADHIGLLMEWQTHQIEATREFLRRAVPVIQSSTAGRTTALIMTFTQLVSIFQRYAQALEDRAKTMGSDYSVWRRLPPDGPQPGDVRSVFGRSQVYVDGGWYVLGAECAP